MLFNIVDAQKWVDDIGNLSDDRGDSSITEIAAEIGISNHILDEILKVAQDYADEIPKEDLNQEHIFGVAIAGMFIGIKWAKENKENQGNETFLKG